jgi:hypothetical protein
MVQASQGLIAARIVNRRQLIDPQAPAADPRASRPRGHGRTAPNLGCALARLLL